MAIADILLVNTDVLLFNVDVLLVIVASS